MAALSETNGIIKNLSSSRMSNQVAKRQISIGEDLRLRYNEACLLNKEIRTIVSCIKEKKQKKGAESERLDSLAAAITKLIFTTYQMRRFKERRRNRRPSREVQRQIDSAVKSCGKHWKQLAALAQDDISYVFDFESTKAGEVLNDIDGAIRGFKALESHLFSILKQLRKPVGRPVALTQKTLATRLTKILKKHSVPVSEGRVRSDPFETPGKHSAYEQIYNGVASLIGFEPVVRPVQNLPKKRKSRR